MSTNPQDASQPTVVLVHGAWADGSSWNEVIERLQSEGIQVTAPANPLRGISIDSTYIASYLEQIPGPVLAVGHSYGGAVITNAATNANNVIGLVYVAAYVPDEGETLADIASKSQDSLINPALRQLQYPTGKGAETAVEFTIDPADFHDVFAADLPTEQTSLMATTQRPSRRCRSPRRTGSLPGRNCHPGRWSLVATRRPVRMLCVRWPSAQGLRSLRWRAPT